VTCLLYEPVLDLRGKTTIDHYEDLQRCSWRAHDENYLIGVGHSGGAGIKIFLGFDDRIVILNQLILQNMTTLSHSQRQMARSPSLSTEFG